MKLLMAANWKMYKTQAQAKEMLTNFVPLLEGAPKDREVALFVPFTALGTCNAILGEKSPVSLGGQNCYPADEGAFTGEISPRMLKESGCRFVLTGHSERRAIFQESDAFVGQKTACALQASLDVVLCVGETLQEREKGFLRDVLTRQIQVGVRDVPKDVDPARLSIAYEPVWAIGTGRVANSAEIVEAHTLVRKILQGNFAEKANKMRILYGGSVKPDNAGAIINLDNVNGVLVGGASLQATNFSRIVLA